MDLDHARRILRVAHSALISMDGGGWITIRAHGGPPAAAASDPGATV